ncbi:hypothetical protein ARAM_002745 [Aspergillus rambellii]|uniref:Uncharacterized protein n=1 Tax=Aspergillus rambellii TaxID=308745 RepID=A0A0F8X5L1_9EURO|nr:hypothetical protein ARAM_002745 [Aspergillus rambellii]
MPTPERNSPRTSWSRRQQQQQQQPHSPFRRARIESGGFDASHGLSPSRGSSAHHRRNFSQTGTLRGAFEAASRLPFTTEGEEDIFVSGYMQTTPNRRRRQNRNTMTPDSNPPNELVEAYRQIDDVESLNDLEAYDDDDILYTRVPDSYNRRLSPGSSIREHRFFAPSDASFTDESPRRRVVDYTKDAQRLKRATANQSPVLNRTGNSPALTSEQLRRREEEEEEAKFPWEEEDDLRPSISVPSTWGSKGRSNQGWMKSLTRSRKPEVGSTTDEPEDFSSRKLPNDVSLRISPTAARVEKDTIGDRSTGRQQKNHVLDTYKQFLFKPMVDKLPEGDQIPNTPITIYKNSTFTKRSPSKRDSQDLLRRLSRAGSPNQNQTSDATKTPETTGQRRIYDKTPVVTGAWIDTPMTERSTNFLEDLSQNITRSPAKKLKTEPVELVGKKAVEKTSSTDWKPQWPRETYKPTEGRIEEKEESEPRGEEKLPEKEKNEDEEVRGQEQEMQSRREQTGKQNKRAPIKPDLPKSALETVLQDHKDHKDLLDVGDDTIESLQELMEQRPTGLKTEEEDDAAFEQSVMEQLELANSESANIGDLDRLHGKLQSLTENIAKVKVGLDSLEVQVSRDNDVLSTLSKSIDGSTQPAAPPAEGGCQTCRTPKDNHSTTIPLPSLRLWKRNPVSRALRLTALGWCIVLALSWYLSETAMCDYYCHPFVGSACTGNCLLLDAPRFPFVIPTMLWRWLHVSEILAPLWALLLALARFSAQVLGLWDGYVDDEPPALNISGTIWIHGTQVGSLSATPTPDSQGFINSLPKWPWKEQKETPEAVPSLNLATNSGGDHWDDGSMDDDEYI